ncbi:cell division ATP-binding protein FtsE [Paracoccus sanguinis]|uniref:Cell division transport system ATP-binding protein n=1 Tax=Paracoccus sanguinis TaxID=1545044 RepID=A0A1H2T8E5_9RHOB|nr:ATP-binding cassette domain-containing protein [Paracoccus sanguinis]KGJ14159.1 cell division protein FtsE [Paracoccus sanguinis]KGJ17779.1 cell division protein FtsE [Paracoccus sanguinis]QJD17282.1 ATP-binding cassette domain-containing protein [Paracoccus sanguinis]SDW40193.1 cell division transport system ATP-binding protein [Paracoccus sanguinis]
MIEMRDVAFAYPRGGALFKGLTLSLPRGSFHFLTGPSGAGKTTFLRLCIADLLPSAGQMTLFGEDAATLGRDAIAGVRRRIGVVHQDTQFLDHLPVAENIALPMMVAGQPIDMQAIRDLLAWVQMTGQARAMPPSLSGGERQRAALARAVILSPDVILADEPTGNLDWEMSLRLLQLLVELNRSGKTVLIATHDLNLIRAAKQMVSARVLRIAGGRLQTAGAEL